MKVTGKEKAKGGKSQKSTVKLSGRSEKAITKARKAKAKSATGKQKDDRPVRVMKFEIKVNSEDLENLKDASQYISYGINTFFQRWLRHHEENGNVAQIDEAVRQYVEYKKGLADKPTFWLSAEEIFPKDLVESCIREVCKTFGIKRRAIESSIRRFMGTMKGQSSSINMPLWWSILSRHESAPSARDMSVIMLDKHGINGSKLIVEKEPYTNSNGESAQKEVWYIKGRLPIGDGCFTAKIVAIGRKVENYLRTLSQIVEGTVDPGGMTVFRKKKKWFLTVSYRVNKVQRNEVVDGSVAYLTPGVDTPWMLCMPKGDDVVVYDRWASDGAFLKNVRSKCVEEEESRKDSMKFHGSGSRGHGRKRARRGLDRSRDRWKGVISGYNKHIVAKCIEMCLDRGIETLVYLRPDPDSECGVEAFLESAGTEHSEAWRGFDWFNVGSMLLAKTSNVHVHELGVVDAKVSELFTKESLIAYAKAGKE